MVAPSPNAAEERFAARRTAKFRAVRKVLARSVVPYVQAVIPKLEEVDYALPR